MSTRTQPWETLWPMVPVVVGAVDRDLAVAAGERLQHVAVTRETDGEHAVAGARLVREVERVGVVEGARRGGVSPVPIAAGASNCTTPFCSSVSLWSASETLIWYSSGCETVTSDALIQPVELLGRVGR